MELKLVLQQNTSTKYAHADGECLEKIVVMKLESRFIVML
jgi:hypothetical protein